MIARQKRYCTSEAFQTVPPDSSPPFSTAIKFDRSKSLDWLSKPLNTTSDGHMFPHQMGNDLGVVTQAVSLKIPFSILN